MIHHIHCPACKEEIIFPCKHPNPFAQVPLEHDRVPVNGNLAPYFNSAKYSFTKTQLKFLFLLDMVGDPFPSPDQLPELDSEWLKHIQAADPETILTLLMHTFSHWDNITNPQ
ncbi:hypothetical protein [Poriferisphaera sp. WC338]|uniref:hypothetical protein n=1 Tax=Poriferisphaera sp. WC338 TaxID=3425129 RepID=UPI003D814767